MIPGGILPAGAPVPLSRVLGIAERAGAKPGGPRGLAGDQHKGRMRKLIYQTNSEGTWQSQVQTEEQAARLKKIKPKDRKGKKAKR